MVTRPNLHELLELFGREQACYTRLLDLSRRQKHCIADGRFDELSAIFRQKQVTLRRLQMLEEVMWPIKEDWNDIRQTLIPRERQVLDIALGTVEELLGELIALERESEQLLVTQLG